MVIITAINIMENTLRSSKKNKNRAHHFKGLYVTSVLLFLFFYGCVSLQTSSRDSSEVKSEKKAQRQQELLRRQEVKRAQGEGRKRLQAEKNAQKQQELLKRREAERKQREERLRVLAEKKAQRQQMFSARQEAKIKKEEERRRLSAEKEALKQAALKLKCEQKTVVEPQAQKEHVDIRQIQEDITEIKQQLLSVQKKLDKETLKTAEVAPAERLSSVIYHIEKGDVLEISVWQHPELSCEAIVRSDGMISFSPLGDIKAIDLSLPELNEKIAEGLNEFAKRRAKPLVSKKPTEKIEYLISTGDILDISVWDNPDLSKEIMVQPDGAISYPLIGEIDVVGLNVVQLTQELTQRLSTYIKDPLVSLTVKSFNRRDYISQQISAAEQYIVTVKLRAFGTKKVVVLGEVTKPGVYNFVEDIQLLEALALAGDCTKYAVKNNVLIIRGDIHKNPTVISANILEFLKHAKLSENIPILPQDIVYVPRSLIGNINTFIETITPIVDTVYKGATSQKALE